MSAISRPSSVTPPRAGIDVEAADARPRPAPGPARPSRAADDRADAGEQLARREGLREVVVRAELEPHHAVRLLAARGEHDDRHVGAGAQLAADLEAVLAGQHEVQQHRVVAARERLLEPAPPVGDVHHREAVALEVLAGEVGEPAVVLDEEDEGVVAVTPAA